MATASAPRVLIVDDEPVVRDVLTRYLTHEGFEVDTAADGHTAMRTIEGWSPHVILLDLMLPELSGLELLRLVRLDSAVPVIILSAKVSEQDRIAGLELGADDYVVKPYSPGEVVARVRAVLRRGGAESSAPVRLEGLLRHDGEQAADDAGSAGVTSRGGSECGHCAGYRRDRASTGENS